MKYKVDLICLGKYGLREIWQRKYYCFYKNQTYVCRLLLSNDKTITFAFAPILFQSEKLKK